jgi:hypothetical protein
MAKVPIDGFANSLSEIDLRLPDKLTLGLAAVDGIAQIVPRPVLHVFDERLRLAKQFQQRSGYRANCSRMKFEPMNPQPPVTIRGDIVSF